MQPILILVTASLLAFGGDVLTAEARPAGAPPAHPLPATAPPVVADAEPFEEARGLLAAGKPAEARASAMAELSGRPYDWRGYAVMYDAAKAEDDATAQLRWGKWLYWSHRAAGREDAQEAVAQELGEIWEGWNKDEAILDAWGEEAYKAFRRASGDDQYRLAGHLLNKLLDLEPANEDLQEDYEDLMKDAGERLSGGAFVADIVRRKSPQWIAKQNAKHEDWENRWERETEYYEIETNLDYAFFETLCAAMDEIHVFYRKIYDYDKRARKARVAVHRKRSDFDRFSLEVVGRAMQSEAIGGYWAPGLHTVVAYDRSYGDPNKTREDLWNTLFHEASHQFTTLLMEDNERKGIATPAWLNEGTASYFEGCRINADGTIVKNDVAEHRLRSWWAIEHGDEQKSLEQLVAHIRNTGPDSTGLRSYEGIYYPYGWAFVYFLLNYEENDRRVYGPAITPGGDIPAAYKAVRKAGDLVYYEPYLKYLEYFAEEGNEDNDQYFPLEMAKKIFVEDVDDPDVPNWEAFEARWRKFTQSLYAELESGWEFADVLQARSRGYLLADDHERARVTAEQANAKRPGDAETYRLLAEANWGEDREGAAAYWMFRHWEMMWERGDDAAVAEAEEWLNEHGAKNVVRFYCEPSRAALTQIEAAMEEALAAGHPVLATLFATHAMQAFQAEFPEMIASAYELGEISGQDMRMWQKAFDKGPNGDRRIQLNDGSLVDAVLYEPDGVLIFNPKGRATPRHERSDATALYNLQPPFSVRGHVTVDGRAAQLLLGLGANGRPKAEITFFKESGRGDDAGIEVARLGMQVDVQNGTAYARRIPETGGLLPPTGEFDFLLEVDEEGRGKLTVNEEFEIELPESYDERMLTGGIAVGAYDDTAALFSGIEVRPSSAFWPVAPSEDEDE